VADDTAAIQNAINIAAAAGVSSSFSGHRGGYVWLPPGQYKVTQRLQPPTNVGQTSVAIGGVRDATVILATVPGQWAIGSNSWDARFDRIENMKIFNFGDGGGGFEIANSLGTIVTGVEVHSF